MATQLNDVEARILGSLIEKSLTTPEQYPLSYNSLIAACNQKTSREPVMELDEAAVGAGLHSLAQAELVERVHEPGSRVPKFRHCAQERGAKNNGRCLRAASARPADTGRAQGAHGAPLRFRKHGRAGKPARRTRLRTRAFYRQTAAPARKERSALSTALLGRARTGASSVRSSGTRPVGRA
jgi:hypothetical protein